MRIAELLSKGQNNAISTRELCDVTGLCKRDLREQVRRERLAGAVILSRRENGGGYYLPETKEEIQAFINTMGKQGRSIFSARKSAAAALKEMERADE